MVCARPASPGGMGTGRHGGQVPDSVPLKKDERFRRVAWRRTAGTPKRSDTPCLASAAAQNPASQAELQKRIDGACGVLRGYGSGYDAACQFCAK